MKKIILGLIAIMFLMTTTTFAQDDAKKKNVKKEDVKKEEKPWKIGGTASVTFLASEFSNSWSAKDGGQSSLTIGGLVNLYAKYKLDDVIWYNTLLAQYTTQRTDVNPSFVKTLDKLELLSIAGYSSTLKHWSYGGVFSLKTQWTPTYLNSINTGLRDSVITTFFAPGEILLGPGMKYSRGHKKAKAQLTFNISPATTKFVIINSEQVADASYDGDRSRFEFGASVLGVLRMDLIKNLTYSTNFELFSNYLKDPQYIDVKWGNILSASFFKVLTMNVSYDLRYDKDISDDVRTAGTFGVGLGYKF